MIFIVVSNTSLSELPISLKVNCLVNVLDKFVRCKRRCLIVDAHMRLQKVRRGEALLTDGAYVRSTACVDEDVRI